jgi:GMP synthase (glutamine-hydrolysing)
MRVLSIIHSTDGRTELFAPAVQAAGHTLEEWSFVWDTPPPRPLDDYDAVLVFGGVMHADQDDHHPWLARETAWLRELLDRGIPILGVCLGVQLLARAAGGRVRRMPAGPEIGWYDIELTNAGAVDPVLGSLPRQFEALQWHHYTYEVPDGAVELAQSERCTQGFRLGNAWGVQFHPELTQNQLDGWFADPDDPPPDLDALRAATPAKLPRWNELGRTLCSAFLREAERVT